MRFGYLAASLMRLRGRVRWEHVLFTLSGALAFALTTWRLTNNGYANLYYAAAVKSMAANHHALFFASLDPSGFVSIDKPPLGFWIQVLSVWVFGFSPLAILLPQAIVGAIAPPLLGILVRRVSTASAGVVAAFALAITPIWIVSARDNIVDVPLALTLILAAAALLKAISVAVRSANYPANKPWKEMLWLTLAFALVGIGFNIKMLEAYLIVPAMIVTYLLSAKRPAHQRIATILLALCVMVGVSLSWVEAVDLTPAESRPYVGSTSTNSELDLAFGYNGLRRLLGKNTEADAALQFSAPVPSQRIGEPGPFRLLQPELGSQASWLAPLALLGIIVGWPFTRRDIPLFMRSMRRRRTAKQAVYSVSGVQGSEPVRYDLAGDATDTLADAPIHGAADDPKVNWASTYLRQAAYLLFALWLLTGVVFFSIARSIDTYYLVVMAPALCAMVGFGIAPIWQERNTSSWRRIIVPIAILATLLEQVYLMTSAARHWATWPVWLTLGLGALGAIALLAAWTPGWLVAQRQRRRQNQESGHQPERSNVAKQQTALINLVTLPLLLTCFITPSLWTMSSLTPSNADFHPIAGPMYAHPGAHRAVRVDARLLSYLEIHRNGARYLVATRDSGASLPLILVTGAPIMTLGGYSGNDPILTPETLRMLIVSNQIRLFLLPANYVTSKERETLYAQMFAGKKGHLPGPKYMNGGPLYHWIATHCAPIPPPTWNSDSSARKRLGKYELFDCSALR